MPALGTLPLSRPAFDVDGAARVNPDFLAETLNDPRTLALRVRGRDVAMRDASLDLRALSEVGVTGDVAYLGRTNRHGAAGARVVAVRADDEDAEWATLRHVAVTLDEDDAALAARAVAVLGWHASASFCPGCGAETRVEHAGWMRRCTGCDAEHFPRTDPAVIVRVTDARDRILLGTNAAWENGRYSLFAGFVEAGESLESAVVREVFEEAGVRVDRPEYLGSQPWPFPRSLMLGFAAQLADDQDASDTTPDGDEILDVRWFTREELTDPDSGILLPGSSSIAHAILTQWLERR